MKHTPIIQNETYTIIQNCYHYFLLQKDSIPKKLGSGNWNCTVPYWDDFKDHLLCNMLKECWLGEDEAVCDVYHAQCRPGVLAVQGG